MSEVSRPNLKKPLIVWAQLSGLYVSNDTGWLGNPDFVRMVRASCQPTTCRRTPEKISMPTVPPAIPPILMLFGSNIFMTFAWYGHLKLKQAGFRR